MGEGVRTHQGTHELGRARNRCCWVTLPRGLHPHGGASPAFRGTASTPLPSAEAPLPIWCRLCPPGQQSRRRTQSPHPVRVRLVVQPRASGCPPGPPPARAGAPPFPAASSCQCSLCPHRLRAARALRGFSLPRSTQRRVPSLPAGTCWKGTPREPLHEHSDVHRSSSLSLKCQPRREWGVPAGWGLGAPRLRFPTSSPRANRPANTLQGAEQVARGQPKVSEQEAGAAEGWRSRTQISHGPFPRTVGHEVRAAGGPGARPEEGRPPQPSQTMQHSPKLFLGSLLIFFFRFYSK